MTAKDGNNPTAEDEDRLQAGLWRQLGVILRALYTSPVGKALLVQIAILVAVVAATAYGQIRLNGWNKPFYDALARRDLRAFLMQLGVFFIIAGVLLVLGVGQRWLVETFKLRLREGLVRDLIDQWMRPRRAFWLAHAGVMGVNPDQRMHEDARKLCELSADLGAGLLQAAVLFASFAGVLWVLSGDFSFSIGGRDYALPGFMLWAAILYAGLASWLSYRVGGSLIGRNAERYAREADLRFSMVRINEHLDGISLAEGEEDEKRRMELDLDEVLRAARLLAIGLTNLEWIKGGFGWITLVAPILVAAPLYFAGKMSFGGLMMAAAAFTQAQSSLRWFVDNFSTIADWRATLMRVASFREALSGAEALEAGSRIVYAEGEPGSLLIENLEIESPTGRDRLDERELRVHAGERVLIVGAPGTAKTPLFRAIAGLWPWGSGGITRPAGEQILYVPHGTPYLPRGSLREVLAYPLEAARFDTAAFAGTLQRLGLERLVPLLDTSMRWDRELGPDEQLNLVFARILLQAPPWVLIDEALDLLDDQTYERVVDVFTRELKATGMIHIGRAVGAHAPLFSRVVHLVKVPAEGAQADSAAGPQPNPQPGDPS